MDGIECGVGNIEEDRFGSVAMMHVEVVDRDAFGAGRQGLQGGDRGGAEVTKSHRVIFRRMMARRTEQAEGDVAFAAFFERRQGSADAARGVIEDAGMRRGVSIEIFRRFAHGFDVRAGVRAQKSFVRG